MGNLCPQNERKKKIMKYVVMVSHGEFAPGLHSAVKMMTGDRDDVLSTSLVTDNKILFKRRK